MIAIPTEGLFVALWLTLMVAAALLVYGLAMTLELVEVRRDARGQRRKVRRQSKRRYRSPGTGEYEACRADDTRRPLRGARHA